MVPGILQQAATRTSNDKAVDTQTMEQAQRYIDRKQRDELSAYSKNTKPLTVFAGAEKTIQVYCHRDEAL